MHNAILIKESQEQQPRLIQTGKGGKRTERTIKNKSERHKHIIIYKCECCGRKNEMWSLSEIYRL
ncbi:MAG: hypothetical protein M5F18_08760 [Asgard group archaeon]|nr:hypothetical protein [Asgard group archaeon]